MGLLRRIFFVIGIVLVALPFLPFSLIPEDSILGFVSNDILSIALGILVLIFAFLSWRASRRRMMAAMAMQRYIPDAKRLQMGYAGQWPAVR